MPSLACRRSVFTLLGCLAWAFPAAAQPPDGPTGTSRQQLVVQGSVVDAQTRERVGLLTLTNSENRSCSASMLNDFWAITAAHCVISNVSPCAQLAPNQVQLTARWPRAGWPATGKTVNARQIIAFGTATGCPLSTLGRPNDVAIVQVGLHDFGRPDIRERKLDERRPQSNSAVTAYGRGINSLAFVGANNTPMQTSGDGEYRVVEFAVTGVEADEFSFFGGSGAVIAGGDSGGPTLVEDWDNPLSPQRRLEWRLVGVHSRCSTDCLDGQNCDPPNPPWRWVSKVNQCWDASVLPVRDRILAAIAQVPPDDAFVGQFPPVPAEVVARKRALYGVSIDEPLIPPADAAIDVQLTFASCHDLRVRPGCPVEPLYEQWSYDPNRRRIVHVGSGRCLNISGARHDAGAPIILFPCVDAANEKWSVTGTSTLVIKSDLTGLCLHALPGRRAQSGPIQVALRSPATLTQMPCDGSDAQRFSDVDADWHRRNGPR